MAGGSSQPLEKRRNEMGKIITTREIDVSRVTIPERLKRVTTKEIKVKDLGEGEPLKPPAGPLITTHNIEEFEKKAKAKKEKTGSKKATGKAKEKKNA